MSYGPDKEGIFHPTAPSVDHFPDDIDIYSFMFEYFPKTRPDVRGTGIKLLTDEETGLSYTFEQTQERTDLLSVGLSKHVGVTWDTRIGVFSANTLDYGIVIWATHRLGGIISAANPSFQPSELSYQLDASKATVLVVNEDMRKEGLAAAEKAGISRDHVIIVQDPVKIDAARKSNNGQVLRKLDGSWTVEGLVQEGKEHLAKNGKSILEKTRRKLESGEGKSKLAFLSFSSGTTGLPKGVSIQHYAPLSNVLQLQRTNRGTGEIRPKKGRYRAGTDVVLGVLPLFHIYGLVIVLHSTFYLGLGNIVMPKFRGIVPMVESCLKYRISIWYLVPPQVVLFCKQPEAQKYHAKCAELVNLVIIGAAPLSDDLSKQFEKALSGAPWGQAYGMTETCTATLHHPPELAKSILGSAGRLMSNVEARIVSPEGKNLGLEEAGELWVRSPSNTLGYSNNDQATKEMFVPGNWVRTGDEAKVNSDGDFFIVDRLKELIKVKGFQVAPAELEGWLLNHPDVSDAMVVGIMDEDAGERPIAFVSLSSDAAQRVKSGDKQAAKDIQKSVMKHVSDHKVRYKHLRHVEIIDAIPKTASGKILRRTGREMAKKLVMDSSDLGKSKL